MKTRICLLSCLFMSCAAYMQVSAQGITTFAGTGYGAGFGTGGYSGDGGFAKAARLFQPAGVATFGYSNVYIADQANHVVRAVNYLGVISTYAGNDTLGYSGDKHAATAARLNTPHGLATDASGNLYIADYAANVVRMVNTAGVITTIAGTGTAGYTGDGSAATAARLSEPYGVAVDGAGNVYIADANNNVIRKVNAAGIISTVAGNGFGAGLGLGAGGYSGDGGVATAAKLNFPSGVAVDVMGNIYIADAYNNVIRKVTAAGMISTIAGNGLAGYTGNGGNALLAELNLPTGIAVDGVGNVYVADDFNNAIRKITPAGTITTIAGNSFAGYAGDGGAATAAQLNRPAGLAVDGSGMVYVADFGNNAVRLVGGTAGVQTVKAQGIHVFPNPNSGSFFVELPQTVNMSAVSVIDAAGRTVRAQSVDTQSQKTRISFNDIAAGVYLVKVHSGEMEYTAPVTVQ